MIFNNLRIFSSEIVIVLSSNPRRCKNNNSFINHKVIINTIFLHHNIETRKPHAEYSEKYIIKTTRSPMSVSCVFTNVLSFTNFNGVSMKQPIKIREFSNIIFHKNSYQE